MIHSSALQVIVAFAYILLVFVILLFLSYIINIVPVSVILVRTSPELRFGSSDQNFRLKTVVKTRIGEFAKR